MLRGTEPSFCWSAGPLLGYTPCPPVCHDGYLLTGSKLPFAVGEVLDDGAAGSALLPLNHRIPSSRGKSSVAGVSTITYTAHMLFSFLLAQVTDAYLRSSGHTERAYAIPRVAGC